MANWNQPTINSNYIDFVTEVNDRDIDAIRLDGINPTNLPINAIRFNRAANIFEELTALPSTWTAKIIGLAGGGTGGSDAASARTALGIGSMGTQNSNAVNITGGSITGVNIDAGAINTGILALARGGTGASLGLGTAGQVLLSNGAAVVFSSGISITNLNASNLTTGTVPDARLSANVPLKNTPNTYTGLNDFTAGVRLTSVAPVIQFSETDQGADLKNWRLVCENSNFYLQTLTDAFTPLANIIVVNRNGTINGIGSGLTNLNATNLSTGTVPLARLGTNAPSVSTYLRGDNTWQPLVAPSIPSGLIAIFDAACPIGWTRVSALDNRFPMGSTGYGSAGGASQHDHNVSGNVANNGNHGHTFSGTTGAPNSHQQVQATGAASVGVVNHFHNFSGSTDINGDHNHSLNLNTSLGNNIPPYLTVVYCRKD